jgi:hypothetical protein
MIPPEWYHVAFSLVGGLLGFWLKYRLGGTLPPEVVELVRLMLARRKEQEAETLLRTLLEVAMKKETNESKKE